jgi:N-acetylmuramoyl-L-alanine amidase
MINARRSRPRKAGSDWTRWLRGGGVRAALAGTLLTLLHVVVPGKPVTFSAPGDRVMDTIPSVVRGEGVCVSLTRLCDRMGGKWQWNVLTGGLRCSIAGRTLELVQGMRFVRIGDTTIQLPQRPFRDGGDLYLAAGSAAEAFAHATGMALRWRPGKSSLVMGDGGGGEASGGTKEADAEVSAPRAILEQPRGEALTTIVIDAGHGGRDPGAIGPGGTKEKDIVLAIALALRDELAERTDLTVHMTRSTDVFVELRDRTRFANEKNADLFVSIHANSIGGGRKKRQQVKGYKVYFLSHAKNEEDRRVAMLENSVVEFEEKKDAGGSFLQNILVDMAANEFLLESQEMSILLAETFGSALKRVRKLHTGVGQGPFWVLYGATMPSVLVETGFISNPREEKILSDKQYQNELASVICDAILEFKKRYERGL